MGIWAAKALSMTLAVGQTHRPDITQRCWSLLQDAAKDGNPGVRKDAAEALSLLPLGDQTLPRLESMLHDRDVAVRIAAVTTLRDFKDKRTVPLLRNALAVPVPEVDFAAAKVLYQLHDPEGEQFLLTVVAGESKGASSYLSRSFHKYTNVF